MRQVRDNLALRTLELPKLKEVTGNLMVRTRARPLSSADRARRRRAHCAESPLPLSLRVPARASGA